MENLKLGFNASDLPVALTNNTSPNDICTSFYFQQNDAYYLLWVEHQNPQYRENEDSPRYAISYAVNEGDDESPEIYSDSSRADLFQSEHVSELVRYFSG
ncbi:hypothetical protein DFP75_11069 [Marinomonas alcarazii]|uniref:Uncharacterized protein n=1 Tax=Marinomonas alcarazii TaxID=491949 RepID=A0A318UUQ0_9GAMM|nr:hypothetical protein [Marinomonas alcarazii]PYF78938.1 hypothetical protein DFP75_11069 [Marinomonas alcarazii]